MTLPGFIEQMPCQLHDVRSWPLLPRASTNDYLYARRHFNMYTFRCTHRHMAINGRYSFIFAFSHYHVDSSRHIVCNITVTMQFEIYHVPSHESLQFHGMCSSCNGTFINQNNQ